VFQELSPHGVLVSGGDVTSARLFVKYSGNREILGLVGYWDVVAWDEYEQQPGKRIDPVMIDTMQNYLANKSFNRGKGSHEASASMAFVGNTKHTVSYMLKNSHLFESIPDAFIKGAFLDRMHFYNPGWEVRVLKKSSFSDQFGFITDYLAEILHELRKQDYSPILADYVKFDSSLSERDHAAIRKTFSGLMKLLFPDKQITREEALMLIDFAVEGRKRVKDQLYIIDETFREEPAVFEYTLNDTHESVRVETLERLTTPLPATSLSIQNGMEELKVEDTLLPSFQTEGQNDVQKVAVVSEESEKRKRIPHPTQPSIKSIHIRENQTGVSYRTLFSDYLKGAKEITIEDPYIRYPYQIRNLVEFLSVISLLNDMEEQVHVHLRTWNDEQRIPEVIDTFDEITDSLTESGIEFTYEFKDFHDRKILTDTGWEIQLGRGLDIFEPIKGYSIESCIQEKRRCKDFGVTYISVK